MRINSAPEIVLDSKYKISVCIKGEVEKNKRLYVRIAINCATIYYTEAKGIKVIVLGNVELNQNILAVSRLSKGCISNISGTA